MSGVRRVGIEHVYLGDTDSRDHRLLRITPCGEGMIGLTIVERTEDVPVVETEVACVIVDGAPLWNALAATRASEGLTEDSWDLHPAHERDRADQEED